MKKHAPKRKLATILATDVVGFRRLKRIDEKAAITALAKRRKISNELIVRHGGRFFYTPGDSVMAEFASPEMAMGALVEIHEKVAALNAGLPKNRRMRFRMGINMGDVTVEGDDLRGDTVRVASRLETLASPDCGICLSENVHQQVKSNSRIPFRDMGVMPLSLKSGRVRAFSVDLAVLATGARPPPSVIREFNPGIFIAAAILMAFAGFAMLMG
ncbi:MAG: adenylate/guanylate cyclase domain-containing protein [Alphaproteobacteria bacterium]|jgi:adenylate cyclase|nr:adenylate/guanylate cyclase domain-containing protein [Alphaproteobacteria bacterium]MBT4711566.1 adenylate/guanylate cyclase domain-containing protein [Alphaproteobacteria bacterium]MBT5860594.1 adenylate/guanylate cyclase domain-containing protein [Alphaproteobacteria bacterium]